MDHWARIEAAIAGQPTDRVPVALWRHFPEDDQDPARLAALTVEWQRAWDFDLVKFMPSGTYSVEDWGATSVFEGAANGARALPGLRLRCQRGARAVAVPGDDVFRRAPRRGRHTRRSDHRRGLPAARGRARAGSKA